MTFRCIVTFPAFPHSVAASYTFAPYWMFSVNENPNPTMNARYTTTLGLLFGVNQPAAGEKHPALRRVPVYFGVKSSFAEAPAGGAMTTWGVPSLSNTSHTG